MTKVYVKQGTGRAVCRLCNNPITKEQEAIVFETYNASAQTHRCELDCIVL